MDSGPGSWQLDLVRQADEHLTAITAQLAALDTQSDVSEQARRCLRQMAVHVQGLADTCQWLVEEVGVETGTPTAHANGVVGRNRWEQTPAQRLAVGLFAGERAGAREAKGLDRAALDPELAAKLRDRVRPSGTARPEQLAKLTPQERRIFELIGHGCTNRQIAARLFLAEKTVKNYVSNMLRKLGMERRTQAAVFATYLDRSEVWDLPVESRPA